MNQLLNLIPDELLDDPRVIRIVEKGNANERIAALAQEIGVDVTVLGTHQYGAIHKYLLGTTTEKLLTTMQSPLLTVKV